jgi:hypothetical protein
MKQLNTANSTAACTVAVARTRPGQGICAYPWHIGDMRARDAVTGINVALTVSKHHIRWPGDPPS